MDFENKFILIADNEYELIHSYEQHLTDHHKGLTVIAVEDGDTAIRKLANEDISLVITALNIANTDGFGLLAHIVDFYPDIPVIVMTESSNVEMESLILEAGAAGCIKKPFAAGELAELTSNWLQREADGGTLRNVSPGMFLQFIEMEQKTCTIRLTDKESGKRGVLFFRNGELLDARVNGLATGEESAYQIFSWDEVTLYFQNSCRCYEKKLTGDLHAILLEAMRLKDEAVVIVPTTVIESGASKSNADGGRSNRRDYRIITKLSDFVYVEFLIETPTGSSNHYRLNVINYSSRGIGIVVSEKDFDLLDLLKKGDTIKNVTFSASWALNTVDIVVRHISKMETGPYAGMYVFGVETRELVMNVHPPQKEQ